MIVILTKTEEELKDQLNDYFFDKEYDYWFENEEAAIKHDSEDTSAEYSYITQDEVGKIITDCVYDAEEPYEYEGNRLLGISEVSADATRETSCYIPQWAVSKRLNPDTQSMYFV